MSSPWWRVGAQRETEDERGSPCRDGRDCGAHLQRGDGLVRVHQVGHDGLQRAVPLAGGSGTRAGVRPELTHLLVLGLLAVVEVQQTAGGRVLQRWTQKTSTIRQTG